MTKRHSSSSQACRPLTSSHPEGERRYAITHTGWAEAARLAAGTPATSKRCFVALRFREDMLAVYESRHRPGDREGGVRAAHRQRAEAQRADRRAHRRRDPAGSVRGGGRHLRPDWCLLRGRLRPRTRAASDLDVPRGQRERRHALRHAAVQPHPVAGRRPSQKGYSTCASWRRYDPRARCRGSLRIRRH